MASALRAIMHADTPVHLSQWVGHQNKHTWNSTCQCPHAACIEETQTVAIRYDRNAAGSHDIDNVFKAVNKSWFSRSHVFSTAVNSEVGDASLGNTSDELQGVFLRRQEADFATDWDVEVLN